jgi:CDP-diglyceride synthetase
MEIALIIVNVIGGAVGAYLLARSYRGIGAGERSVHRQYGILISVYFVECVSMALGMGIPVFSIFLSFVWAAIFGMRLSKWESSTSARKASFFLSLYTSLPVMTFIIVPIGALTAGQDIVSVEAGSRFGIPQFSFVPAPVRTILGFYIVLVLGGFVFKTLITMGGIALVVRGRMEAGRRGSCMNRVALEKDAPGKERV